MTISIEQPSNSLEITPLEGQEPVEDAYRGNGSLSLPKESNTSLLFFYDGPNGVSLVAIQDSGDGSGGRATLDFDGLPADGEWVVQDDHNTNDFRDAPDTIKWLWYGCCADGGAFRGGLDGYVDDTQPPGITIHPNFKRGIDNWIALSGSVDDPDRFELNMEEDLSLDGGSGSESNPISASVATVQFIPGKEENPSKDGHPLDSGLMHIFPPGLHFNVPRTDLNLGALPILDSWMGGDMTDDLPMNIEEAREPEAGKYAADAGDEAFKHYRIENGVTVSFDTTDDGGIVEDTVEIEFHEDGPDGGDPRISRGEQKNSQTVLHDSDWNTIPWEEWYGENVRRSNRHPRHYEYDTEFEFDGVEGVRVLTILGGWAGFMGDVSRRASNDPVEFFDTIWGWNLSNDLESKLAMLAAPKPFQFAIDFITTVPNTFTFIDFVVLADGRRFVRIWDASQYPSLAIYVDGARRALEKMSYDPREPINIPMSNFMLDAAAGTTPYTAPAPLYKRLLTSREKLKELIGEYHRQTVNVFRDPVDVEDLVRPMPRNTLEIGPDGDLVENPDNPFGSATDLPIPLSGTLNSK